MLLNLSGADEGLTTATTSLAGNPLLQQENSNKGKGKSWQTLLCKLLGKKVTARCVLMNICIETPFLEVNVAPFLFPWLDFQNGSSHSFGILLI